MPWTRLTLWDCPPFLVQCCWKFWRMSLTYSSTQNVPQVLSWIESRASWSGQGIVVIAFRCKKSISACVQLGLALSSINTDFVAKALFKVRDNGFQDVPLISWPITITVNSDQIQLAIIQNVSPHHHRTIAKWNGFLDAASDTGGIWLPLYLSSSISHVQKKAAVNGPNNLSPRCKIQSVAYLVPCQTCCFVCWCQKGMLICLLAR